MCCNVKTELPKSYLHTITLDSKKSKAISKPRLDQCAGEGLGLAHSIHSRWEGYVTKPEMLHTLQSTQELRCVCGALFLKSNSCWGNSNKSSSYLHFSVWRLVFVPKNMKIRKRIKHSQKLNEYRINPHVVLSSCELHILLISHFFVFSLATIFFLRILATEWFLNSMQIMQNCRLKRSLLSCGPTFLQFPTVVPTGSLFSFSVWCSKMEVKKYNLGFHLILSCTVPSMETL